MPAAALNTTKFYTLQVQAEPEVLEQIPADAGCPARRAPAEPPPSYQHDPERLYGLELGGVGGKV